jgi:acyl-CoA thioesterase-2
MSTFADLLALLDLENIEVNIFRGHSPAGSPQVRVFGGQVAGQALVAAARTVESPSVHSLHAYFLRPGDAGAPILYQVDRIRDGRSYTTRRVVAVQHGQAIFNLQASFHRPEPGLEHQIAMPEVPDPESIPTFRERMEPYKFVLGAAFDEPRPLDIRHIGPAPIERTGIKQDQQLIWFRTDGTLPDDAMLHACIVTYASDLTLLDTAVLPHGYVWPNKDIQMASLDHAMWFHRPFRADEWLLYQQTAISTSGSRGLAIGSIFTRDGALAVSVVQEGVIRKLR